eukprot:Phypoly_transcript_12056.p1 GENE.Phypoly_transcript_12056~~Phypoly_transcript_12056.p1  ORF type:complete len:274 (+),score=42.89 Phypoly_transcript_12056:197-1018(+)
MSDNIAPPSSNQHNFNLTSNVQQPPTSTTNDTRDFEENTPLISAASNGQIETVKQLLDNGAHPDSQNVYGYTPLLAAISRGHLSVASALIQRGANVHLSSVEGESALHFAAIRGDESLVASLLENGAFLNIQDAEGDTVLHWVVREKTYAMLNYLLQQKHCNSSIPNEDGETPLHLAACLGDELSVDCLLKHNANPTLLDSNGQTPLDLAVESGEKKVIDLLGKFKPTPPSRNSRSPHRCATTFNNYERRDFLYPHSIVSSPLLSFREAGSSF